MEAMDTGEAVWEYNCPQFVDFTQPMQEDHSVDEYFDFDHENDTPTPSFSSVADDSPSVNNYSLRSSRPNAPKATPSGGTPHKRSALKDSNNLTPRRSNRIKSEETDPHTDMTEKENVTEDPASSSSKSTLSNTPDKRKVPSNLCTSLEDWNRKKASNTQPGPSKPSGSQKNKATTLPAKTQGNKQKDDTIDRKAPILNMQKRSMVDSNSLQESPNAKKHRRSCAVDYTKDRKSSLERPSTRHRKTSLEQPKRQRCPSIERPSSRTGKSGLVRSSSRSTLIVSSKSRKSSAEPPSSAKSQTHARSLSMDRNRPIHQRSMSANRHKRSLSCSRNLRLSIEGHKHAGAPSKANTAKERMPPKKPSLTVAVTPAVLKREKSALADQKSQEQREMEEIKKLRKELVLKRKLAEESHKKAMSSAGYAPIKSVQAPTRAESFSFATDQRIKSHPMETRKDLTGQDFASALRHGSPPKVSSMLPRITVCQPFNLHEDKKRKRGDDEDDHASYKSMAEQLQAFSRKTPDRFRTKPLNMLNRDISPNKRQKQTAESKLTVAKTPNLETRSRSRPVTIMSQADIDAKELEEIRKYKFKAQPMNERIFKSSSSGIHRVAPKEPTVPEGFDLETDRRIKDRSDNSHTEEEHYEFHANPVPKQILEGIVGIKRVPALPLTKPLSPAFALKNRLRSLRQQVEQEEPKQTIPRAKPVPHLGIPFQPKLQHRATAALPFSFETRNRRQIARKEEKIKKIFDDEKRLREFHANPLPSDSPDNLPNRKTKAPTVAEPFQFEDKWPNKAQEWEQKMEEELRQQRQQASFKARPAASLYKQPFMPKKSTKILTDGHILSKKKGKNSCEFELSTERRQGRWAELERYKLEKEAEIELQQRETERRQRDEEEAELKRLRTVAVHHANPIRHFKEVEIKSSDKPLTQPETPRFSDRLKSRFKRT